METIKKLRKSLAAVDSKIEQYPPELVRRVRAVESMRLYLAEQIEQLDIDAYALVGSLDETGFADRNNRVINRVRARLQDHTPCGLVVSHYRSDPEFVRVTDKLIALADERARIAADIRSAEEEVEKLRAQERAELEAAKAEAVKAVETKGTPGVTGVRQRIAQLLGSA